MAINSRLARTYGLALVTVGVLLGSVSGLAGTAVGEAVGATPTEGQTLPRPGSSSFLNGVWCLSSRSCWAVGTYITSNGAQVNQALRWNGRRWSEVSVPQPGGTAKNDFSELIGVTCSSSKSCWAVGDRATPAGAGLDVVLRWNGKRWSNIAVPDPSGAAKGDLNNLSGVRCVSSADCWAVGSYGTVGSKITELNQVLHWNGRKWSKVSAPSPGGTGNSDVSTLSTVRCTSSGNCWAVGAYSTASVPGAGLNQALRWNGTRWFQVTTPNPAGTTSGDLNDLVSLTCSSARSCWAVGAYETVGSTITALNQMLHWNGRKWSKVAVPNPDGTSAGAMNLLQDANCTSPARCWAVGTDGSTSGGIGAQVNQALRWNGMKWSLVRTPDPAGTANGDANLLAGIRCTSSANCWAVGNQQMSGGKPVNQALHWNGIRWSGR